LCVSAELVRDAARQAAPVIGELQAELPPLVPGYRTKILAPFKFQLTVPRKPPVVVGC